MNVLLHGRSLRPLIVALMPGQQRSLIRAKELRERLTRDLAEVVNEYGPKLYDDFDQVCIRRDIQGVGFETHFLPCYQVAYGSPFIETATSADKSPRHTKPLETSGSASLSPYGKFSTLPGHSLILQSKYLNQTWLDEKLFGWSTSSKRGTNAWAGSPAPSTRATTPEMLTDNEEEEEEPDYDDMFQFLEAKSLNAGRSRTSSYADLQKLRNQTTTSTVTRRGDARMTPLDTSPSVAATAIVDSPEVSPISTTSTTGSSEGIHLRHGERVRRSSLTDGVSVKRIGRVNRRVSFEEATAELNTEIRQRRSSRGHEE